MQDFDVFSDAKRKAILLQAEYFILEEEPLWTFWSSEFFGVGAVTCVAVCSEDIYHLPTDASTISQLSQSDLSWDVAKGILKSKILVTLKPQI